MSVFWWLNSGNSRLYVIWYISCSTEMGRPVWCGCGYVIPLEGWNLACVAWKYVVGYKKYLYCVWQKHLFFFFFLFSLVLYAVLLTHSLNVGLLRPTAGQWGYRKSTAGSGWTQGIWEVPEMQEADQVLQVKDLPANSRSCVFISMRKGYKMMSVASEVDFLQ